MTSFILSIPLMCSIYNFQVLFSEKQKQITNCALSVMVNMMVCSLSWLQRPLSLILILFSIISTLISTTHVLIINAAAAADTKAYIVYMGEIKPLPVLKGIIDVHESIHLNLLDQVLEKSSAREALLYSYGKSFNGFAAMLTDQEQKKLTSMKGVVSVFPSGTLQLHTSKSWDFVGFPSTVRRLPAIESDIIIGMLDTGIWPESDSFNDDGFGPPPKKWKGVCQKIKCNNKIIGARFYKGKKSYTDEDDDNSPLDTEGHGSHTASTVAGREVRNVSLSGLAKGTIRGAVPFARIAVYKVCWPDVRCQEHDILAAFDDAIADGVDILSVSLGGSRARDYDKDTIAIGSFHAMKKGILTSTSAGNSGPSQGTVANVAPWLLTVAAINTDRQIINKITLGNHETLTGVAVNTFPTSKEFLPLIYGSDAASNDPSGISQLASCCFPGTLNETLVKGKIVICSGTSFVAGAFDVGAKGIVMVTNIDVADSYPLPAAVVSTVDAREKLDMYMNSTRKPIAIIHKSRDVYDSKALYVVSFSSRGYNRKTPDILKPDVSAPGADILAAWSPEGTVSGYPGVDARSVKYNIVSGTSMACPHATGAAAYVKTFHPKWTPAAIKSALMTTAYPLKGANGTDDEYAYGSGEIDPVRAVHPGLIYDTNEDDYIQMLCVSIPHEKISIITGGNVTCLQEMKSEANMNYPSISVFIRGHLEPTFERHIHRTVTNVGSSNSTYKLRISPQPLLNITVTPDVLYFKSLYEKQNFTVNISGGLSVIRNTVISAQILWSDGIHEVRSPIVVWVNE